MDWWSTLTGKYVTVICFNLSYFVHIFNLYIFIFIIFIVFLRADLSTLATRIINIKPGKSK